MGTVAAVSQGPVRGFQCTSVFIIPWALTVPLRPRAVATAPSF